MMLETGGGFSRKENNMKKSSYFKLMDIRKYAKSSK